MLSISKPSTAHRVDILVTHTNTLQLENDPDAILFERTGNDLSLSFDNGGRVLLQSFFAPEEGDALPSFTLPDGSTVSGKKFLSGINPEMDLTAAAGAESNTVAGSGVGEYADDSGALLDGVDRLGALSGLSGVAYSLSESEMPGSGPLAALETGGDPFTPGPDPVNPGPGPGPKPGEPEKPGPEDGNYYAKVILSQVDGGEFSFYAHDANGVFPVGQGGVSAVLSGANAQYFETPRVGANGAVTFTLNAGGLQALALGDINGEITVTLNGVAYPVYLEARQEGQGSSYTSPSVEGGRPVSEWYESHGFVNGATISLSGGEKHNSVVISARERTYGGEYVALEGWVMPGDARYNPDLGEWGPPHAYTFGEWSHDHVVAVKNSEIRAGAGGNIAIDAQGLQTDIPSGKTASYDVYGIHAGSDDENGDETTVAGGTITVRATGRDNDPATSPVESTLSKLEEESGYGSTFFVDPLFSFNDNGYRAVGIMNEGATVDPWSAEPFTPSSVTLSGRTITVAGHMDAAHMGAMVEAVGIGQSTEGDIEAGGGYHAAHTKLQGDQNNANNFTISGTVAVHYKDQSYDEVFEGAIFNDLLLSASGIAADIGDVTMAGGGKGDNFAISASLTGDLGDIGNPLAGGIYGNVYSVYGVRVGNETFPGESAVCIRGGAGQDTLTITAAADVALKEPPVSQGEWPETIGKVYGLSLAEGGTFSVEDVENITIRATAEHDAGGGAVQADSTAIRATYDSEFIMKNDYEDMAVRLEAGDRGVHLVDSKFSLTGGKSLDLAVTAGRTGISSINDDTREVAITAGQDLSMKIIVDGSSAGEHVGLYDSVHAGLATAYSGITKIESGDALTLDIDVTATAKSHQLAAGIGILCTEDGGTKITSGGAMDIKIAASGEGVESYAMLVEDGVLSIKSADADDTLSFTGDIKTLGGTIDIETGRGADTVTITGDLVASSGSSLKIDLGEGNDTLILNGSQLKLEPGGAILLDGGTDAGGGDADVLRYHLDGDADTLESLLDAFAAGQVIHFEEIQVLCSETEHAEVQAYFNAYIATNPNDAWSVFQIMVDTGAV